MMIFLFFLFGEIGYCWMYIDGECVVGEGEGLFEFDVEMIVVVFVDVVMLYWVELLLCSFV